MTPVRDTPVKVAHLWGSVLAMIITIGAAAGGVIWSIAVFKTDTTAALVGVGVQIEAIKAQIGVVSASAQESRDWIMRRRGAEEEQQRVINQRPQRRGVPVLSPDGATVQ